MTERTTLDAADGHVLAAHYARPDRAARGGLVVVHEIFGVDEHIRDVCDRFASQGWVVVAPALFDRVERDVELEYGTEGVQRGTAIRSAIELADVLTDVAAAAEAVAAEVGGHDRVAVVGDGWGGSIAAAAACHLGGLFAAAVGYDGEHVIELIEQTPSLPLLLHFGALGDAIASCDVGAIRAAWPEVEIHVHDGAEHGFNCDASAVHHPDAAREARARTIEFLREHVARRN